MDETYTSLIPSELDDELIQIGESTTEGMFRIGEIANYVAGQAHNVKKEFIYSAIGSRCGKSKRTVREFADVEEFFHDTWRSYEILSFDHFRQAYKHKNENWRAMLEWALVTDSGRPQTVDAMVKEFTEQKEFVPDAEKLIKRLSKLVNDISAVVSADTGRLVLDKAQEIRDLIAAETGCDKEL